MYTGTVIEVKVVPYDITKVETIKASLPYSPYNYNNIVENCKSITETLIISIQDDGRATFPIVERISDIGITSSWFCAIDCLAVGLYEPSVLFASIAVECVLNHDVRLDDERIQTNRQWLDLNAKNLELAHNKGLPTNLLLKIGESFASGSIEFVMRRNKVAHGDLEGYLNMHPGGFTPTGFTESGFTIGYSRPSRKHALSQIDKAKNFIVEWAKQKPQVRLH